MSYADWERQASIELKVAGWEQHPLFGTEWLDPSGKLGYVYGIENALVQKRIQDRALQAHGIKERGAKDEL